MSDTMTETIETPARKRPWALFATCAAAAIIVGSVLLLRAPAAEATAPIPGLTVEKDVVSFPTGAPQWRYVELSEATVQAPLPAPTAPGRVAADDARTSAVAAPLPGRVEQVLVRVGDRVVKGQRLVAVRSGALADVDREIASATAQVEARRKTAEHTRELVKLQAATEREALVASQEQREAELALAAATARRDSLDMRDRSQTLLWLTSPRDGSVVDVSVFPDQQVAPESDRALVRVADLREVVVFASLQERDSAGLQPGQRVEVRARGDERPLDGRIESVSDVVDPQRRTVEARIRLANPDRRLRPNAQVDVTPIATEASRRVRVPLAAVVTDGNAPVVFVQPETGHFERTPVRLGREHGGEVEVLAGLTAGQQFVSKGALLLLNVVDLAR